MNIVKPQVSLNISNIDASVAFYEKVFGAPATKRRPGYAKLDLTSRVTDQNTECCYALQDKVWVEDPDGNSREVFVVKGEATTMEKQTSSSGCCVTKVQSEATTKASGGCCG
jgi:predicted enzyme related to lactoylglutathione lyase